MSTNNERIIYVKLLDEDIDVWRPVKAKHIIDNIYFIIEQEYDRSIEKWEFEPFSNVICTDFDKENGKLFAKSLAEKGLS